MIGNLPNKFSSEQDNLICHDRFFFPGNVFWVSMGEPGIYIYIHMIIYSYIYIYIHI